jgi:hypothetical protein
LLGAFTPVSTDDVEILQRMYKSGRKNRKIIPASQG